MLQVLPDVRRCARAKAAQASEPERLVCRGAASSSISIPRSQLNDHPRDASIVLVKPAIDRYGRWVFQAG
jgi:hypothetical protein